jgi:pentatricopeptide repeat protein
MVKHGVTPTPHIYSLLITTYAADFKDAEAGQKAVRALEVMKQAGERPNYHVYTAVISALGNHRDLKSAMEIWKEVQSVGHEMIIVPFNAVLNALRVDGTTESAMEAEAMMRSFMKLHQPNEITFATVMGAWAHLGRVDRTLELFNEMKRDYPTLCNLHVYSTVMNAYVIGGDPIEAAHNVEMLLQEVYDAGLPFNSITLTIAIKAFTRNPTYREKAILLLKYLEEQYRQSGDESMKPLPEAYDYLGIRRSV